MQRMDRALLNTIGMSSVIGLLNNYQDFSLFSEYYKILNCLQTCVNFLNRKEFGQAVILL